MESVLQKEFKSGSSLINLPSGEFKENIIIDRPCTIIGDNTTLWNESSPVLMVRSNGVILKNLKLELTSISGYESDYAILQVQPDTIIENVEIYGGVADTKKFYIPRSVHLGEFKSNVENTFILSVVLPERCIIEVNSLNFTVSIVEKGSNHFDLIIKTNPLEDNSMLYGEILLKSKYIRRIFVDGKSLENAPQLIDNVIYTFQNIPKDVINEIFAISVQRVSQNMKDSSNSNNKLSVRTISRGERYNLDYTNLTMKLHYKSLISKIDIDPYIFLTDENNQTIYNEDMIFFGSPTFANGSVCIKDDNYINIQLDRIPPYISKVCVCYSIYKSKNEILKKFSNVKDLLFTINTNNIELFKIKLEDIEQFSTIILAEFYRHNGIWKINPVICGYRGNLPQMCKSFGIDADY